MPGKNNRTGLGSITLSSPRIKDSHEDLWAAYSAGAPKSNSNFPSFPPAATPAPPAPCRISCWRCSYSSASCISIFISAIT